MDAKRAISALFPLLMIAAGCLPLLKSAPAQVAVSPQASFPAQFEGRAIYRQPLTEREEAFLKDFPGEIARFTDGSREILFRVVNRPTRQLHSSGDCLKAAGYSIEHQPMRLSETGEQWGCFTAGRNGARVAVCERVYDSGGQSFSDVSSWFWSAILGRTEGPWVAVTVASQTNT